MLETVEGKGFIRHYMFDFGSILGSGSTRPQGPRAGNEYILEWAPAFRSLVSLGLYLRPWMRVDYPEVPPSVGRFESDFFDPLKWKPEYPNPAFDNMRPDDAFWAARILRQFSDEMIGAVVAKAAYSDPVASDYIVATLIARRDKVLQTWLTGLNPVGAPRLTADGLFAFENIAVDAGVATTPSAYDLTWTRYDNEADATVGAPVTTRTTVPTMDVPSSLLAGGDFLRVEIRTLHPEFPLWEVPVRAHFRRSGTNWDLVGLVRLY